MLGESILLLALSCLIDVTFLHEIVVLCLMPFFSLNFRVFMLLSLALSAADLLIPGAKPSSVGLLPLQLYQLISHNRLWPVLREIMTEYQGCKAL